jgi:CubicO group peptidase (beta-lactamase class C family)
MKTNLISTLIFTISFIACKEENKTETLDKLPILPLTVEQVVDSTIIPYVKHNKIVGISVGVFKSDEEHYFNYGKTVKSGDTKPTENTLYEVNSLTKAMTSILLVRELTQRGKTIDEPISNLLPANIPPLTFGGQEILVKHLLNHTSGLPELPANIANGWSNLSALQQYDSTDLYDYLKTYELTYKPGTLYMYSNTGFGLAGVILERLSKKSYEDNLIEHLCEPLSLSNTRITINDNDIFSKGYDAEWNEMPYLNNINALKGSVSVRSTSKDLITYGKSQLDIDDSALERAMNICHGISFSNPKVGLDWEYETINNIEVISHAGGVLSFNSRIYISKNKKIVLVILSNTDMGADGTDFFNMTDYLAKQIIK